MTKYRIVYQNTSLEAPEGSFLIGRGPECHLVLNDPSVSRVHCAITLEDGLLLAEDRGSRNGVILNGKRIKNRQALRNGDVIAIGRQKISIVATDKGRSREHTQGLFNCSSCGSWIPSSDHECGNCGIGVDKSAKRHMMTTHLDSPTQDHQQIQRSSVIERHPIAMLAGLALKAMHVDKTDEALRLIANAISSANERIDKDGKISDDEFESVVNAMITLAEKANSPSHVSDLFAFHLRAKRLISRNNLEKLYDVVRPIGYRVCSNMNRYLGFLDAQAGKFSPGERFIHRRLTGLAKICS